MCACVSRHAHRKTSFYTFIYCGLILSVSHVPPGSRGRSCHTMYGAETYLKQQREWYSGKQLWQWYNTGRWIYQQYHTVPQLIPQTDREERRLWLNYGSNWSRSSSSYIHTHMDIHIRICKAYLNEMQNLSNDTHTHTRFTPTLTIHTHVLNRVRQMRTRQCGDRKALCSSAVAVTDPGINHV